MASAAAADASIRAIERNPMVGRRGLNGQTDRRAFFLLGRDHSPDTAREFEFERKTYDGQRTIIHHAVRRDGTWFPRDEVTDATGIPTERMAMNATYATADRSVQTHISPASARVLGSH